ncbi:MAG: hypothetical protein V4864_00670 [Pseudomonadota bacterium]
MNARAFRAAALVFLLLAIAAVAGAFLASQRRIAIQGPSAIAVLPDGGLWLAVEDALWRLDADGHRTAVLPSPVAGARPIASLAPHPDGRLVAWVRGEAQLQFLDAQTAAPRGRMLPQWPADLREHGERAIHYAFHPDGRVAIATGGGHAVALFDAGGSFLARTAPGTYEFTNGLWWSGDSLWTTDTNRYALVELDGATLARKSRVPLVGMRERCRFVGMVAPRDGGAAPAAGAVTLVRFANGMLEGEAVDVLPDGTQHPYRADARLEPRDVKWRKGELLLVDGASYAVKRFSAAREQLGDFGDSNVQDGLARSLRERQRLATWYQAGVGAAVVLFLAGLLLAWRASVLDKGVQLERLEVDLSQLGTPLLDTRGRLRLLWPLFWPMLVSIAVVFAFRAAVRVPAWMGLPPLPAALAGAALVLLVGIAAVVLVWRKLRNAGSDPHMDAFLNQAAVTLLAKRRAFWELREPGELPRETLMLTQAMGGRHWLVLTNRRLLVFVSNLTDQRLKSEHARRDIVRAAVLEAGDMRFGQRLAAALFGACWLRVELRDGTRLEGMTMTRLTARRFAGLLRAAPAPASTLARAPAVQRPAAAARAPALSPGQVPDESRAAWQTLASLLVPGLGQWMQRRAGTALLMFLAWAAVLILAAAPVAWTLWAPRAAVSLRTVGYTLLAYASVCFVAGLDAWRMRVRVR